MGGLATLSSWSPATRFWLPFRCSSLGKGPHLDFGGGGGEAGLHVAAFLVGVGSKVIQLEKLGWNKLAERLTREGKMMRLVQVKCFLKNRGPRMVGKP